MAVDVQGNRFTASIDGERIDPGRDDTPAQGGVGFFSEPGENARLYWMKLSRNQDLLGRFCAYLSRRRVGASSRRDLGPGRISATHSHPDRPSQASRRRRALSRFQPSSKHSQNRRSEAWIY